MTEKNFDKCLRTNKVSRWNHNQRQGGLLLEEQKTGISELEEEQDYYNEVKFVVKSQSIGTRLSK